MKKEDFYTGEPIPNGSPPFFSDHNGEAEAIENASFGKYNYDPGNRLMNSVQSPFITPGGYGYNQMNGMMGGIGMPMMPQMNYQNNQYGFGCNPAIAYQQQQQMMYMQQQQYQQSEVRVFVPPINFSNDYLPPIGFEDQIEKLKLEYWQKEQEQIGKEQANRQQVMNPFGGFQNYYGVPFYNPYQYSAINNEIANQIEEMKREARENRISLNMKLSKLAHAYLNDGVDSRTIEEMYTGKEISVPVTPSTITPQDIYQEIRLRNLVPFDNSNIYREMSMAVTSEFHKFVPPDSDMQQTFQNMGIIDAKYALDEEQHRRRNGAVLYNSDDNSYKYFVRRKAAERHAQKTGYLGNNMMVPQNDSGITPQSLMPTFPTLSQSATLTDDGTLNITCNFGSKMGQTYSVHNSEESKYSMDKERFRRFIDSIPGSIYLNNPNQKGGD